MIKTAEECNKVRLRGTIANSVRQKYDARLGCQLVYFILAVPRLGLEKVYNGDDYNFFYCYISENLMPLAFLEEFKKQVGMYDELEVVGLLDNRYNPLKNVVAKEVNYRALNAYVSTICIKKYEKIYTDKKIREKQISIMNSVRKIFGKNTKVWVEIDGDALKKDVYGLKGNDLPDY